ncbi:MAG: cation:proton antiporter [Spirochaetes bacterium GWB1_36_13]|nr:MAG: cation:proton antiporter [Spirochaetes bacterium GWB1_36_13]
MNLTDLFLLQAGILFLIGIFGILTRKNIFKILMSINILQTGVNLLIVGLGYIPDGKAPIITESSSNLSLFVDPLPQALILTSIVIGFGTTALGLVVALRYHQKHKTIDFVNIDDEKENEVCE